MCKKLIYLIVLVLGLAGNIMAEDLDPPDFAGAPGSGYAQWELDIDPGDDSIDATAYAYNPEMAEPYINGVLYSGYVWVEGDQMLLLDGGFGDFMFNLPTPEGEGPFLTLHIQMTYSGPEDAFFPMAEAWAGADRTGDFSPVGTEEGPDGANFYEDYEIGGGVRQMVYNATTEFGVGEVPGFSTLLVESEGNLEIYEIVLDAIVHEDEEPPAGPGRVGVEPELASSPSPEDEATDVPRDVVLSWTPGEFANTHNVYLGTAFDDVNDAVLADAISPGQTATIYDPEGLLDFGQTYYWRIDEVNSPPDNTIFKGSVWSFTTELYAYPIEDIIVTSSGDGGSDSVDTNLNNVINGSGLDEDDMHSTEPEDMWLTQSVDGAWIQFEFDKAYKLHEMLVWNYNETWESILGFGFNAVVIEYSSNGTDFTTLDTVQTFDQAPGQPTGPTTVVDFGGAIATHVKITANSNFSDADTFGLSEVRFLYIPVRAREPEPTDGAENVPIGTDLCWRAGRDAGTHDVLIGTAMDDLTLVGDDITEASFIPDLALSETYYWQVLETDVADLAGDIWSFSTQEFLVVDDFESYNDIEPPDPESNRIYETWKDGYENSSDGSTIGYVEPYQPSMESEIVHSGDQSVPLMYDNSVAGLSEVTVNPADLPIGSDWSRANIKALTLYIHGSEDNLGGQLYVKVNDVKRDQIADLAGEFWQEVNIDLASFDTGLQNVTSLTIGIAGAGSSGLVYIDDIRLYPSRCISEKVPGDLTGDCIVDLEDLAVIADNWLIRPLSVEYTFDSGFSDTSGNNRHGVGQNNPTVASGILTLNGTNFVDIPLGPDNPFDGSRDFSVAMDFKTSAPSILLSSARDAEPDNHSMSVFVHHWDEPYWGEVIYDNFWVGGTSAEDNPLDGEWHTMVVTYNADGGWDDDLEQPIGWATVYLDRVPGEGTDIDPNIPNIAADTVRIGGSLNGTYPYDEGVGDLDGDIDNIRIFNFTLTLEDVHRLPAVPTGPADLNGDGIVDQADQDIVEANMGPEKLWP